MHIYNLAIQYDCDIDQHTDFKTQTVQPGNPYDSSNSSFVTVRLRYNKETRESSNGLSEY